MMRELSPKASIQQLALPLNLPSTDIDQITWFQKILTFLGINRGSAWCDQFGLSLRYWLNQQSHTPIKTLSLFSGGGGLDIAFHDAGFDIVQMVELEPKYIQTLEKNSRTEKWLENSQPICIDIRKFFPSPDLKVDFIIGGPPCQSFSAAGRRAAGVAGTNYAARIMEIAMHSLFQAMQEYQLFGDGALKPLSQMRSANKKHGNVGDIEILESRQIIETGDAKYGKAYLRDELEELADKLEAHPTVVLAGFVTSTEPERRAEIVSRCQQMEEEFGITVEMLSFKNWIQKQFSLAVERNVSEEELASAWITAYTESLAQQRRDIAPIDEPCFQWLATLNEILQPK